MTEVICNSSYDYVPRLIKFTPQYLIVFAIIFPLLCNKMRLQNLGKIDTQTWHT